MIKYFWQCWNPFNTWRFPYCLYRWVSPLWYMILDIFFWIRHGYPRCFTWNVDLAAATFLIPLLKHLRDHTHGFPIDMHDDPNKCEYTNAESVTAADKWTRTLNKMIKAFENVKTDAAFTAWGDHYKKDMKLADELRESIEAETAEGLALFAKYYQNLWD